MVKKVWLLINSHFIQAGLVTTLSTKTTVFGATNPKGQYDPDQRIPLVNVHLFNTIQTWCQIMVSVTLNVKNNCTVNISTAVVAA